MSRLSLRLSVVLVALGVVVAGSWPASPAGGDTPAKARTPQEILKYPFKRPAVRATLAQALADLGRLAEVPIAVDWQGLLATGVKPDATVSLPATEAPLERLLEQTLAASAVKGRPLAWMMVDDRVCVTTQARVLRGERFMTSGGAGAPAAAAASRPAEVERATTRPAGTEAVVRSREFQFNNTPLSDAIDYLRHYSGVNMVVNYKALETSGVAKDTPISLKVTDVTVSRALDLITEQLSGDKSKYDSVYWVLDDGVVKITTGSALDSTLQTRVFDVGDLLLATPTFENPPRMTLNIGTGNTTSDTGNGLFDTNNTSGTSGTGGGALTQRDDLQAKLTGIIQKSIGEDMWQPQGKGSVSFLRNTMIITQTRLGFLLMEKTAVMRQRN